MNNRIFQKLKNKIVALALLSVLLVSSLAGCLFDFNELKKLEFTVDSLSIVLGDEIDLYDYLNIEPIDTFSDIRINSTNDNIVTANNALSLKSLSVGRATITAVSGRRSDTCSVEVVYNEPTELEILAYGELFRLNTDTSSVDFVAITSEYISPSTQINWYVNNVLQSNTSKYFSFSSNGAVGAFTIKANIKGTEVFDSVVVYSLSEMPVLPKIDVESSSDRAIFTSDAEGLWEFFANDEKISENFGSANFTFEPQSVGSYHIRATLYGVEAAIGEHDQYVFIKAGNLLPTNLRFEYDNCYPNSYVYWDLDTVHSTQGFTFVVMITDSEGSFSAYSSEYNAALFTANSFNSSGVVGLTTAHVIDVQVSYDPYFSEGEGAVITTTPLSQAAISYLAKKYLDKNYYITSDQEFFEIYEYTLWMRRDKSVTSSGVTTTLKVFMAYTSLCNAVKLSRIAWARSAQSGYYYLNEPSGSTSAGSTLTLKITYGSDNFPTKTTSVSAKPNTLLRPHIDFKSGADRDIPIEDFPLSTDVVTTSNELFFIVENGFKPNVKKGSSAEEIYDYATRLLSQIITDDMDELEKLHVIYDWILWRTHYDKKVENISDLSDSVKYAPYYLESVFSETYPFSVCDGLSKAFSLLANMEGIKTVRVAGKADMGNNSWGDHAWNKVLYEGEWFLVDCTWGDYEMMIDGKLYETASHQYFLLSSADLSMTHRENAQADYPTSSKKPLTFFRESVDFTDGIGLYFFESSSTAINKKASNLVSYVLSSMPESPVYSIGSGENNTTTAAFYGTDFFVPEYLSEKVETAIVNILSKTSRRYVITKTGDYMYILIKY